MNTKTKQLQTTADQSVVSALILNGDLSKLSPADKVKYYNGYCDRLGLDPFTKPFDILRLNGREVLYCTRTGTQQLNKLHNVSHTITGRDLIEAAGVYQVTAKASLPDGRCTESIGAVNIAGLKGEQYANAIMKAETKAKRRATLDLLGLGVLDESEVESIPNAQTVPTPKELEKQVEAEAKEQFTEVEAMVRKSYETEEDLLLVLDSVETLAQLKNLYIFNQKLVDTSSTIKSQFKSKQNVIKQSSVAA
jgi:hypothetical protein